MPDVYVPRAQEPHVEAPAALKLPELQLTQEEELVAPTELLAVPAAQERQTDIDVALRDAL